MDFPTYHALGERLSRIQTKDLVADYTRDPKTQHIYETVQSYVVLGREMAYLLRMGDMASYEIHKVERRVLANEILENFSAHGGFILQQGLTKGHLEITAGLKARTLSPLEERVLISLEQYMDAATSCRALWNTIKVTHPGVYAKQHPRYAEFKIRQDERGSLAHSLLSYAPIVRSFGKELYAGTGYGFTTLQKQGVAFEEQMLERAALTRLSGDEQRDVALYKAMVVHQHFATQLYKEQRAKDAPLRDGAGSKQAGTEHVRSKQRVLFKTLVTDAEKQERLKMEACAGALASHVLNNMTHFETLLGKLNLTINPSALTLNAQRYERQRLIHIATGTEMPFAHEVADLQRQLGFAIPSPVYEARHCRLAQMIASHELVAQIDSDAAANRKAVTKAVILTEVGSEGLGQVYTLSRHAQRLLVNVAFGKETLNAEVYALINYSDACGKASQLWARVRREAAQNPCAFNKTASHAAFEIAAAERDCLAYQISRENTSSSHNPLARLRQANALLMGSGVGVNIAHFEKHTASGFLHQACLTMLDPHAPKQAKDDAMDILLTGLMLDDQRVRTVNILDSHNLTKMYLVEKSLEMIGDKMPSHKIALNTYQQALMGYKKTFRDFIKTHGTDFKLLEKNSPEALSVREAEKVRDEAAFHLRPLLTDNVPHMLMADLLTHLKVNQHQILHQGDRFESLSWVRSFNETRNVGGTLNNSLLANEPPQTHKTSDSNHIIVDHADIAYHLLERFALEGATKTPSSVTYALKTTGVTLNDLHTAVKNDNQSMVSDIAHTMLVDYHQNVMAFGQAHQTLMTEFNEAKSNQTGLEKPKHVYISHMPSYAAFWKVRTNLARIAYTIQEQPGLFGGTEGLINTLSERSLQKLSAYAHIYESMLLIQGYAAAKAKGDPVAGTIAYELTEIIAFEAHEKTQSPSSPLVFGTTAALYHFEINRDELERDAALVNAHISLRANDIAYLLDDTSRLPVISQTAHGPAHHVNVTSHLATEGKSNEQPQGKSQEQAQGESERQPFEPINGTNHEPGHHQSKDVVIPSEEVHEIISSKATQKKRVERPSSESTKDFTRDVKKQLVRDIEKVAVTLLGQPKRIEKNGIWHWSDGIRLHTQNGVVPRGTFKNYSQSTDNIDVFGMIKNTHGFTHTKDAIHYGATLCGMTFEEHKFEQRVDIPRIQAKTRIDAKVPPTEDRWKPIFPVPEEMEHVDLESRPGLAFMLKTGGIETMRFAYRDENDRLLGYVVRLETEDGHKQTLPLTYCENGKGIATWKWKGFGDKTPLYGLDQLARNPHAPVLLVEGEKAADAAQKLLPDMVVLSWVGGSAGVKKVDLTPIQDKTVVMWPDNDAPGAKAAATLAIRFDAQSETAGFPNTFKVIDIPHEKLPQKWDLADPLPESMTLNDVNTYIVHALSAIEKSLVLSKESLLDHKTEAPQEHIKTQSVDMLVSKSITFAEINVYSESCGLEFVANAENMHFILHVANTTIKDLHSWHGVLGTACDHDQLRIQAIATGVYAAWAKERDHLVKEKDKDKFLRKYITIGSIAGKECADLTEKEKIKTDEHSILFKAQATYESLEKQTHDLMHKPHEIIQSCGAIVQEEIIRTAGHCLVLTGHTVPAAITRSLVHTIGESLSFRHDENQQHKERDIIQGVIAHTLNQHGQGMKVIEPIHHEAAYQAHQLEHEQLHQAAQRVHLQTRQIEQQREAEREVNRGIER